jgi:hypothetical protein
MNYTIAETLSPLYEGNMISNSTSPSECRGPNPPSPHQAYFSSIA